MEIHVSTGQKSCEPHELLLKEVLDYARNNLALIDVMIQGPYITSHECH